jgi:hypothetical protein
VSEAGPRVLVIMAFMAVFKKYILFSEISSFARR